MLKYPVKFVSVTSPFGRRTYTLNGKTVTDFHYGIDLGWHETTTVPIYAVDDGVVQSEGMEKTYGAIYCIIYHKETNMLSIYWHLSKTIISKGDVVKKGQQIGNMGKTGLANAPHLHYAIWKNVPKGYILNWKDESKYAIDPITCTYLYDDQEMHEASLKYHIKQIIGTPVARNTKVDQIEIKIDNLNCRNAPEKIILGYIQKGIYNILSKELEGDYTWFEVEEDKWVAYDKSWAVIYLKQESELELLKKENAILKTQNANLTKENLLLKDKLKHINKISTI